MSVSTRIPQTTCRLSRAVVSSCVPTARGGALRFVPLKSLCSPQPGGVRQFSATSQSRLKEKEAFPEPEHDKGVVKTAAAWPHPGFDLEVVRHNVHYEHRLAKDFSDHVALGLMRMLRWGTDLATGYHHDDTTSAPATTSTPTEHKANGSSAHVADSKKYRMSEKKWLIRFVFLESVAGVPGMVAGMLRHLRSMRTLKRDNGWIETLLEESYNERMHLLTFLQLAEPGRFMKLMVIGAQGVFFNALFLSYLVSPRTVHRFVGYLEEEAVLTYGLAIKDLEEGKLPKWEKLPAPDIAIDYWKMPEGQRSMMDLLWYIRADESKHREVNHTLANLKQSVDANPFVSEFKENGKPHPGKGIEYSKGTGWERKDVV